MSHPSTKTTTPSNPSQNPLSQTNNVVSKISVDTLESLQSLPIELRTEIEAATFRRLVEHLQKRNDVQNIDLMNLAGFCRNCLSKWYRAEAEKHTFELADLVSRERVYGMPYAEWKAKYQK